VEWEEEKVERERRWDGAMSARRRYPVEEIQVDKWEKMGGEGRRIGRSLAW
jgi:hypothetical protein